MFTLSIRSPSHVAEEPLNELGTNQNQHRTGVKAQPRLLHRECLSWFIEQGLKTTHPDQPTSPTARHRKARNHQEASESPGNPGSTNAVSVQSQGQLSEGSSSTLPEKKTRVTERKLPPEPVYPAIQPTLEYPCFSIY